MLLLMLFGWALAGTTGKIAGRISDAKTGESLIGVNLQLEGTALGSSTDVDGYFVILNVPPGLYNLNISYIGY
ncbi:MAG: carboxypeptidase-like regulatory domain-containing protein, partial [Calditrichaeota bacterium]|nr:carboxypeptidase-like regulatory domain-containing protein [Calditrichota bacterium]